MTALRQRMIEDMQLRNLSPHTIEAYVSAVARFAKHFGQSPEQLNAGQVRQYLLHLVRDQHVGWSRYNIARCGLQFFYTVTLGQDVRFKKLPCARAPKRLPTVLSRDELRRLFEVVEHDLKHKALLMTLYAAGLRVSEALALKAGDIDSPRMLIHVRLGKGNKDRMVKLSAQLLAVLRDYWRARRPKDWLFPQNHHPDRAMESGTAQRIVQRAAKRAGITRRVSPHCPKCQASACARWMEDRAKELLPVEYFHVVFTLPDTFNALALGNKRVVYGVLFDAVAQTLLEVAANPKRLGARIGFISILHTWGQNLYLHPHIHCVVPGGGLSPDGSTRLTAGGSNWISCKPGFFLPVRVLSKVFRGKFIDLLKRARSKGKLIGVDDDREFERQLNNSVKHDWVVYAKPPFGGPQQVLKYLARYTHRIAISNRRLVSTDNQSVTFKWKDYAHHNKPRTMTLDGGEFLRRFLLHAVPTGFMRIRHFGLLANRVRSSNLAICRQRLNAQPPAEATVLIDNAKQHHCCPECKCGTLHAGPNLSPMELHRVAIRIDSS